MRIGVTGGIGSGKSTVCNILCALGFPVYNSDLVAKALMNSDENLKLAVKKAFGESIYKNDQLDRTALAEVVFNNADKLEELNKLVHPAVAMDFELWCLAQGSNIVIKEAAILFETGGYQEMDQTILIYAPKEVRIARVMKRDGSTESDVLSRMSNQWSDEMKMGMADEIIQNHNGYLLLPQILKLVNDWEK